MNAHTRQQDTLVQVPIDKIRRDDTIHSRAVISTQGNLKSSQNR
jgi:hypothetical protein